MSGSTNTFKDAALRAVGRTVVNFQRLEHNLKIAARLRPLEGVLAKVEKDLERRSAKTSSFTLGQSIEAWLSAIKGSDLHTNPTADLFDPTIRLTFSFEWDSDSIEAHGEALKKLLELRNNLIHGGLVNFQWDSEGECNRLVAELTDVNEAIGLHIDFVAAVLKSLGPGDAPVEEYTVDGARVCVARLGGDA